MGMRKSPMGSYSPSEKELTAMHWCIKQGIRIAPFATGNDMWFVEIDLANGKGWQRSPNQYGKGEIWEVIYNYYLYYYEKGGVLEGHFKESKKT